MAGPAEIITSAANPVIKRLRQLAERKHRRREGAFVVEGAQPVWCAVEAGAEIEMLVVSPELAGPELLDRLLAAAGDTRVVRVSGELFRRLSDRDDPAGLAAVVRGGPGELGELRVGRDAVIVALHEIGNPGNLGTIVRTADATGAAGVVLIGDTSDPHAPAAVKASMGSLFAVPVVRCRDLVEFFDWAGAHGVPVVAAAGSGATAHWDAGYPPPVALLLGAEGPGLPAEALRRSDRTVRIPMTGTAESLNLSVAAGVLLYELRRDALRGAAATSPAAG